MFWGSFKPFQGLFYISTLNHGHSLIPIADSFKPFQGLFYISTSQCVASKRTGTEVSNPSRGYSTFLPSKAEIWICRMRSFQTLPGVILHFYFTPRPFWKVRLKMFQTLPGVILHFYLTRSARNARCISTFQTLPGVILHFYAGRRIQEIVEFLRFKPFQGLFYISTRFGGLVGEGVSCFKPFQGLFYISTVLSDVPPLPPPGVSNPSRGYSTFLLTLI